MWAVQRCNYYIVHLLLESGADPLLTDNQGYNILHLATFDGNVFLIVLLLHQNIPIDGPDPLGHTCLMWAAYKGYQACLDLYLRWGASVDARDSKGFTALHWALVKGSQPCIQKLVEYGSDRFAETSDGKSPSVVAKEMNSTTAWYRALNASGYDSNAASKPFPLPYGSIIKHRTFPDSTLLFVSLHHVVLRVLHTKCGPHLHWPSLVTGSGICHAARSTAAIAVGSLRHGTHSQDGLSKPSNEDFSLTPHSHSLPECLLQHVSGSAFDGSPRSYRVRMTLMIRASLTQSDTYSTYPAFNFLFAVTYGLCGYFYGLSMLEDPGYLPKGGSLSQQKAVIDELLSLWKFDDQNFCTQCMIRTPLRSKHCKRCRRCVAKHDQ